MTTTNIYELKKKKFSININITTMKERYIWMRLGISLRGTEEEIESLFNGDEKSYETLTKILQERKFEIYGDSYIPDTEVEEYNKEYNTHHEVEDYGFNL